MHKHHILPKHMGGTDDPENLVTVTVEQHAALHKQLWEDLGQWQDFVAYKMLSGQIGNEEATKMAQSLGAKNRPKKYGKDNHFYGKRHSQETKEKIAKSKLGREPFNKGKFGKDNPTSRWWQITKPNGEVVVVKGLSQYCRDNNLTYQAMGQVAKGKLTHHKKHKCKVLTHGNPNFN